MARLACQARHPERVEGPNAIAAGKDGPVSIEAFETTSGDDDVLAFATTTAGSTFNHSFATANSHRDSDAIYGLAVDASNNVHLERRRVEPRHRPGRLAR